MDDREMIYENVKALAKINNQKLGDIETEIGVTKGYLSRKSKGLTIHNVHKLAKHFDITIDDLVSKDYWYEYRSRFAIDELDEAVKRAKKCLTGSVILAEVNKILECERGNEDEKELCDNAR
jgi:transcriptional regulator with XRE-family HTH domain